jgi:hypothetical protein
MPDDVTGREVRVLRLLLQMNNRLRLEVLAALSRVFREHGVAISDNLFGTLTFAIPDELPGTGTEIVGTPERADEQPPSTDRKQPRSTAVATPQPPSTSAGTQANTQPPSTSAVPQPPSTSAIPQAKPQPPSTSPGPQAKPQPPSTAAKPQPPSSGGGRSRTSTGRERQSQSSGEESYKLKKPLGWERKS